MKSAQKIESPFARPLPGTGAFTLTELVVVIATIAILAVMLAPALAATKPGGKMAQCLNDKRQLTLAWQMYASDNADSLVSALTWIGSGSYMDWSSNSANTNAIYLTNSTYALFGSYIQNAAVYKCPADFYQSAANPGPRVRSVSMSATVGGISPVFEGSAPDGGSYIIAGVASGPLSKMSALTKPGPASTFVFLDEHPDSIDDGVFFLDPGFSAGYQKWRNLPASYHNGAAGISFADGHAEMHQWVVQTGILPTDQPVKYSGGFALAWENLILGVNADYEWVEAHMPYN